MASPLAELFDADVVCLEGNPYELAQRVVLFEQEEQAIARAVERRRVQYRATRYLARVAFRKLGYEELPLVNHKDRSPLWPLGLVGSLTHTDDWCALAVARGNSQRALGIDGEDVHRLKEELYSHLFTDSELMLLRARAASERPRLAALMFSAKESLYKCQFPLTRRFLGFHDVELQLNQQSGQQGSFSCRFIKPMPELDDGCRFEGRYLFSQGRVVTSVTCRQTDASR